MRLFKFLLTVVVVALAAMAGLVIAAIAALVAIAWFFLRRWNARLKPRQSAPAETRDVRSAAAGEIIDVTATEVPAETAPKLTSAPR